MKWDDAARPDRLLPPRRLGEALRSTLCHTMPEWQMPNEMQVAAIETVLRKRSQRLWSVGAKCVQSDKEPVHKCSRKHCEKNWLAVVVRRFTKPDVQAG